MYPLQNKLSLDTSKNNFILIHIVLRKSEIQKLKLMKQTICWYLTVSPAKDTWT